MLSSCKANTAQLKGASIRTPNKYPIHSYFTLLERLRRLELYGLARLHPSEAPRRQQASVLVFHMADVDTCDAS